MLTALSLLLASQLVFTGCGGGGGGGGGGKSGAEAVELTGRLVDGQGAGLAGLPVALNSLPVVATMSDADGRFTFSAVPGGYELSVSIEGAVALLQPVVVPATKKKSADEPLDLGVLQVTTTVSGGAVDGFGAPLPGVPVFVSGTFLYASGASAADAADAEQYNSATLTGLDGEFTFELPDGDYTYAVSVNGKLQPPVPFQVAMDGGASQLEAYQAGTVVQGQLLDGLLDELEGCAVQINTVPPKVTHTDSEGHFALSVLPGAYTLSFLCEGVLVGTQQVAVSGIDPIDLGAIQVGVAVFGQLLDGLLNGLAGCAVQFDTVPAFVTHTDGEGKFKANVPAGNYTARVLLDGSLLATLPVQAPGPIPAGLGSIQVLCRVTGRVIDDLLLPVAGAEVVVDTAPLTITATAADGTFLADLPFATLSLSVNLFGVTVQQLALAPDARNAASGVVPLLPGAGVIALPVLTANPQADSDGDGLGDSLEVQGWTILVDQLGDGLPVAQLVTSLPTMENSDNDDSETYPEGLPDGTEFLIRTDPRQADTDHDLLSDVDEINRFKSNPSSVDTDGDARPLGLDGVPFGLPNPSLFDGLEYTLSHTSPTLDDTDGDGIRDDVEILEGGTNPLISNLPRIELEIVGLPFVALNKTVNMEKVSSGSTLASDSTESTVSHQHDDVVVAEMEVSAKEKFGIGTDEGLLPSPFPSASVEVETTQTLKGSYTNSTTHSTNATSAKQLQTEVTSGVTEGVSYDSGTVKAIVSVRNASNITIEFSNLEIVASRLTSGTGFKNAFQPLGILRGNLDAAGFFKPIVLGPEEDVLIEVLNEDLNVSAVEAFVNNPLGMKLQLGNYTIRQVDAAGNIKADFDVVLQNVQERTANLLIDYGDGHFDQYSVASNVERNPDGSAKGLTMPEVLADVLHIPYELKLNDQPDSAESTLPKGYGASMLYSLANKAATTTTDDTAKYVDENGDEKTGIRPTRLWFVSGPTVLSADKTEILDFEDLRLLPGSFWRLAYTTELDGDGLTGTEELFYGTSDLDKDSDGDKLDDNVEVETGMQVVFSDGVGGECPPPSCSVDPALLEYTARSNPRFKDTDGDGESDYDEKEAQTDPNLVDTDKDGSPDSLDTCQQPTCGSAPGTDLAVYLPLDYGSFEFGTQLLLDESGKGNHASHSGKINAPGKYTVDKGGDPLCIPELGGIEEGWYLSKDSHIGVSGAEGALVMVNDDWDSTKVNLLKGQECNGYICDGFLGCFGYTNNEWWPYQTDAAYAEIPRKAQGAPRLNAVADSPGSRAGWTAMLWVWPVPCPGTSVNAATYYSAQQNRTVLCQMNEAQNGFYFRLIHTTDKTAVVYVHDAQGVLTHLLTGGAVNDLTWTHLAVTVENDWPLDGESTTTARLYVNGFEVSELSKVGASLNPSPVGPAAEPIRIAWNGPKLEPDGDKSGFSFNGGIDELLIYDTALTPDQVKAEFERGSEPPVLGG